MSYFQKVLKDLKNKQQRKTEGLYNGIPLCYERHREYVSSIDKGMFYSILGAAGEGKSRWSRYTFLYQPLKFAMETGYAVKVLYFALEDSKLSIYKKIVTHYLWEVHKIDLPTKVLESKIDPIPEKYMNLLIEDSKFYEMLEESLFIIEDSVTPSEIYNNCVKFYNKYGAENHLIVIIDNSANVLKEEKHFNEHEALEELTRKYIRLDLCKKKEMSVLLVCQSDLDSVKHTSRNAGKGSLASIEPNMSSLGNNKQMCRSFHVMWALFSPWRYEIAQYPNSDGYNISVLRNRFKSLLLLKNNEGEMAPRLGLYFNGGRETFEELPVMDNTVELDKIYKQILYEQEQKIARIKGRLF